MAAIDFPNSPTVGQAFTAGNGVTYVWNGTLWLASGASAGAVFLYNESVLASPALNIDVTIPANTKRVELDYWVDMASAASEIPGLRVMQSGVAYSGALYNAQMLYGQAVAAGATNSGMLAQTVWQTQAGTIVHASVRFRANPANGLIYADATGFSIPAGGRVVWAMSYDMGGGGAAWNTVTGFRLVNMSGNNFKVGSYMRAYVCV